MKRIQPATAAAVAMRAAQNQGAALYAQLKMSQLVNENEDWRQRCTLLEQELLHLKQINDRLVESLKHYQKKEAEYDRTSSQGYPIHSDVPPAGGAGSDSRDDQKVDAERYLLTAVKSETMGQESTPE